MNKEDLKKYMLQHSYTLTLGAALVAKATHSSELDVRELKKEIANSKLRNLKILIFDIETSPMKAYVWKRWKENISLDLTISEWFLICWSAKWLYSNEVMGDCLTPEEVLKENDFRITKSLWDLFNEADIVVSHNGNNFDIPKMNSRFICNNMNPPTPFISIDTCAIAKKQFGFSSNKLDALATYFGFEHKLDTDFNLWKSCLEGNKEALDYMLTYNKRDVTLLEEVYLKLRPYIKNHPNCSNFLDKIQCCSNCGNDKYTLIKGLYYYTQLGKYNLYRCNKCGAVFRGRNNLNTNLPKTISTLR